MNIQIYPSQTITVTSEQFLTGSKDGKPAVVAGELRVPNTRADRVPAVVIVHGVWELEITRTTGRGNPTRLELRLSCLTASPGAMSATPARRDQKPSDWPTRKGYHRAMGGRNYLIEGVSGAGKTAVCTELQRRGYQAVHGDRELVYRGDPETGLPTAPQTGLPTAAWVSEHQIWDVEKVQALVANQEEAVTFFCGGSRNFAKFIDFFDGVFVLEVDLDTMNRRIDERVALDPTDFGGKPEERELAVRLHQTKEDIPKNGIVIDATAPLARVVDEILRLSESV
jgi:predicted ATPase